MHAGQPILAVRGRRADPRVAGNTGVTQGMHVRPILFDPCAYLISSADRPVTRDEDIDVAGRALEQPQRGEVVPDRVRGAQVGERNQDVRKHIAGDENAALLDQQRRMARGMRLMLDNPDPTEFAQFRRAVADRLKRLVQAGLLTREDTRAGQRARYSLTEPAIQLVPVFAQLGSWGRRHRPTSRALRVRAELLEQGGPALWQEFMDELRRSHLGSESPARSASVRERLNAAYLAATNSS